MGDGPHHHAGGVVKKRHGGVPGHERSCLIINMLYLSCIPSVHDLLLQIVPKHKSRWRDLTVQNLKISS